MKLLTTAFLIFVFSSAAFARATIECTSSEHKFTVQSTNPNDVRISYRGETVVADGLLNDEEVDLVAKFKSIGEMTLFAKIGKVAPENYIFLKGKRFSVICR